MKSASSSIPMRQSANFCRLSPAELQDKMAMGLCFRCGERYSREHQCATQLRVILMHPEEEDDIDEEGNCDAVNVDQKQGVEMEAKLSYHSIADLDSSSTLKLRGSLQDTETVVLLTVGRPTILCRGS